MSDFSNAPRARGDFDVSKGELHPARSDNVLQTVRAEIENSQREFQLQDAHIRSWQAQERRLSHLQEPVPEFDLGSRGHRNLMRDYEERAFLRDQRGSAIERHHAERRALIRENGQTLSNEFRTRREARPERLSPYLANHEQANGLGRKR